MDDGLERRRGVPGRERLPVDQQRRHCVSVRLNPGELEKLDRQREKVNMQRGEYLRAAALHKLPPTIPEINREAWADLGRALGNFSTIATAMRGGEYRELTEIQAAVRDLRGSLIGVKK